MSYKINSIKVNFTDIRSACSYCGKKILFDEIWGFQPMCDCKMIQSSKLTDKLIKSIEQELQHDSQERMQMSTLQEKN